MITHHTDSPKITPAATVILTREHAGSLQVYLLKRSPNSGFMAGNFVFPGGTVDREDRQTERFHNHCDMAPYEIATRFGPDLPEEQALVGSRHMETHWSLTQATSSTLC
jgi:8-oxo-dGTP pyrophosphatase MutT (NUDIX family)